MRILLVHNYYGSSAPSGENVVFETERDLLRARGHTVETFTRHSDAIRGKGGWGLWGKVVGALSVAGNPFAAWALAKKCRAFRPDVVHFHNTFPLVSALAVRAAARFAPVVMTLHNYRLVCAAGTPFRDGAVCTACSGGSVTPALRHRCYRQSLLATVPLAFAIALYRRPLSRWVARFIVLSEFQRRQVIACGFPAEKVVVKPNAVADTRGAAIRPESVVPRDGLVYVGRLSPEKGLETLLKAWNLMDAQEKGRAGVRELWLVGGGPQRAELEAMSPAGVRFVGVQDAVGVKRLVSEARCVILPSVCWETFGLSVVEALCEGTPAVVSDVGALPELVRDGVNGFVFQAGDEQSLAAALRKMLNLSANEYAAMRRAARRTYVAKFTEGRNYESLMAIYEETRNRQMEKRRCHGSEVRIK